MDAEFGRTSYYSNKVMGWNMALGWVYILSNESMPGLIKIGQSAADPELRAYELHTTGVPSKFHIEYKGLFNNYAVLERQIHLHLRDYRHKDNREFFRMCPSDAISAIREVAQIEAKYEEMSQENFWRDEGQGYCRSCGVVVAKAIRECLRCGALDPAN